MSQKNILIMLSGGLDSLGALQEILTNEIYKDAKIHVHHVNIINKQKRNEAESKAVGGILEYYKDLGLRYTETTFKIDSREIPFDTDITSFVSGYLCTLIDYDHVVFGVTKDDVDGVIPVGKNERACRIFESFVGEGKNSKKLFPVSHLSKKEIYQRIPDELKSIFWSCRKPTASLTLCGKCKPCLVLENFQA